MTGVRPRIGIFGGSFNPLHQGHLIVAEFAAESISLDKILFTPVVDPPHKDGRGLVPIEHRCRMIDMSIGGNDRFDLSMVDSDRPGPHYSVDTVQIVGKQFEGSDIYFVMGGDSLRSFPKWHDPMGIVAHCRLAVMRRPSYKPVQPDMHDDVLPGLSDHIDMIEAPPIGISSTRIREQLQMGKSVRYLVPDNVLDYIHEHQLYYRG
ncbi:MAG: nicotinate (nicotinamide) nucleotide adenylyltransferase [Chloroflexota bacterium]